MPPVHHQECRIPPQGGQDTPRTQRMEANPVWVRGFVRVILLEQVAPRMSRIHQLVQFSAQDFYLFIGEDFESPSSSPSRDRTLSARQLTMTVPASRSWLGKEAAERVVVTRGVFSHARLANGTPMRQS